MSDTRLIPISTEDVERLQRMLPGEGNTIVANLTKREQAVLHSLVIRFESGITEAEAAALASPASKAGDSPTPLVTLGRKLRAAFKDNPDGEERPDG